MYCSSWAELDDDSEASSFAGEFKIGLDNELRVEEDIWTAIDLLQW